MDGICKLCGQTKPLRYSHVHPAFAVRWLKQTSITGYLKSLKSKVRLQDARRVHLLCDECEQLLSRDEKLFAEQIFVPYHEQKKTHFNYDAWLRRFIVGLHWKVLVTREEKYPDEIETIYNKAESDWRHFLLGQAASPGDAEFHLFLSDIVDDSTGQLPEKFNWYLSRGFDATPFFNKSQEAGVYAMVVRTLTFSYLTPMSGEKEIGTQVFEQGTIGVGQTIQRGIGKFIVERAKSAMSRLPKTLSDKQKQKLMEEARTNPAKFVRADDSFRTHHADVRLTHAMQRRRQIEALNQGMKGRDRNQPCPCGSGKKYKKCHGYDG
jgi:hypothetical protein